MITMRAEKPDQLLERSLFLLVAVIVLHSGWLLHSADPYEFLRHGGDALGYYQWLPATMIKGTVDKMFWTYEMDDGRSLSLFSCGVAILQLPFFLIGHLAASVFHYDRNGFSSPYGVAQLVGAAIYTGAGCVLAFRIARRFAAAEGAMLAVLSLFAASNLFYYVVYEPTMSHMYSFFLVGLFIHCTLRLLDDPEHPPNKWHAAFFIISGSLLVLVRQLNVLVFLFPLMMAWRAPMGIRGFARSLFSHRLTSIGFLVLALIPWLLQCLYWKHVLGEFFAFAYGKKGETFHFDKMVPGAILSSVRNGWLVYTPMMFPLVLALLFHAWRGTRTARTILLVLTLTWLVYSAWWCWWLGTSFSYRGFVDLYALLVIPLAWLFGSILRRNWSIRLVSTLTLVALIKLNFGLMERFNWQWSWHEWTWQRFFAEVSAVITA